MKSATMSMSIVLFALLSLYVQPAAGFDGGPASMQLGEEKLVNCLLYTSPSPRD